MPAFGLPAVLAQRDWHKAVWVLAAPLMLSNIAAPLLALVDTAVIGRLPEPHYLGAVAVGGMIMTAVAWGFSFLRMSTGGLTAQAAGAEDWDEVTAILGRGFALAAAFGLLIVALQGPVLWIALRLVEGSAEVERLTATYFLTRVWGAPASFGTFVLVGWLLGNRRPVATLAVQVLLNGLNAALSVWFVLGLGWGVFGVALASVIAEYVAFATGLVIALRVGAGHWHRLTAKAVTDLAKLRRLMALNVNIFIRTAIMLFVFSYFTAQGAAQGDVLLATNTVLMQFFMVLGLALDAFADAAEVLVGRRIGSADRRGFYEAVTVSSFWSVAFAAAFALVYLLVGGLIVDLLTTLEEVRAAARIYLPWAALLTLSAALAFAFDGVYLGATRPDIMRNAVSLAAVGFFLGVWFMMARWGNHGLWGGLIIFMVLRAAVLGAALPRLHAAIPERPPRAAEPA